jgi:hypothetical protein
VDVNVNSRRDEGDLPLSGVTVTLRDYDTRDIVRRMATGPDGRYGFEGVPAGVYTLEAVPPVGHRAITPQSWAMDIYCAVIEKHFGYQRDKTVPVTSTPCLSRILGMAWVDVNGNGSRDEGDQPLNGVTLTLRTQENGLVIREVVTGPDGRYAFHNVLAGIYTLEAVAPAGYRAITPDTWGINISCATLGKDFGYALLVGQNPVHSP